MMHGVGAPVVIGPMNGGMKLPKDFGHTRSPFANAFVRGGRRFSALANFLIPGKRRAAALLVANERTRRALPAKTSGFVATLVENGIDSSKWRFDESAPTRSGGRGGKFIFVGRLETWKGVNFLLDVMPDVLRWADVSLDIIGDGPARKTLEEQCQRLKLGKHVRFRGWIEQSRIPDEFASADALVLPSYYECGGAVVLEAMAAGLPVIAADWGGPADYVTPSTGILVTVASRYYFNIGLTAAMLRLARDPELRKEMGAAGRKRVMEEFTWEAKAKRILDVYRTVLNGSLHKN
jgi:glycosyltransferase involved in cell wall biosynthesis